MEWDIDWGSVGTFLGGGGLVALVGGGLYLWKTWRVNQQEAAKGDIDVIVKETEANDRRRKQDATFKAEESDRVIAYWKALTVEISDRNKAAMILIDSKIEALEVEAEKRREEHTKCREENAMMKIHVEHLKEQFAASVADRKELRDRVAALENQQ